MGAKSERPAHALRNNLVGLSDLIGEVQSLRRHYPDAKPSIDPASAVFDKWHVALLAVDDGDASAAQSAMVEAKSTMTSCRPPMTSSANLDDASETTRGHAKRRSRTRREISRGPSSFALIRR